ncbi:MAG TPA: hypothetical protein VIK75_07770 [Calditerricola sp.]
MLERLLSQIADTASYLNLEAYQREQNANWYAERGRHEEARRHRARAEWCKNVASRLPARDALNQYRRIVEALDWARSQAEKRSQINRSVSYYVGVEWGLRHALALIQGQPIEDWVENFHRFCWGQSNELVD